MCKNCSEKLVERTGRIMLFCKLKGDIKDEDFSKICTCQRYCNEKDRYIPYKQRENCKNFENIC